MKVFKLLLLFLIISLWNKELNAQNWLLVGNTPTANQFLGTTNNTDLRINTNGTQRMVVLSGGNVGINITNPANKLHIVHGTTGSSGLRLGSLTSSFTPTFSANGKVLTVDANGDVVLTTGVYSVGLSMPSGFTVSGSPITSSGTLAVTTTLNGILRGNGSGFTTGAIDLATADVTGILPYSKGGTGLSTLGSANQQLRVNGAGTALEYFTPSGGGSGWSLTGNSGTTSSNFIGTTDAQPLIIKTNNTEAARILSNGNFLLGSSTDQGSYKLQVNGNTYTKGTALFKNWDNAADYVLNPDFLGLRQFAFDGTNNGGNPALILYTNNPDHFYPSIAIQSNVFGLSSISQYNGTQTGFTFNVPSGRGYAFSVNNSLKAQINSNGRFTVSSVDDGPFEINTTSTIGLGGIYYALARFESPNMAPGQVSQYLLGRDRSLNNQYSIDFKYAGNNSTSNAMGFGFYANNDLMKLYANGNLTIGTVVDAGYKLDVNGAAKIATTATLGGNSVSGELRLLATNNNLAGIVGNVDDGGKLQIAAYECLVLNALNGGGNLLIDTRADINWRTYASPTGKMTFLGNAGAGTLETKDVTTGNVGFRTYFSQTTFKHEFVNGNVSIGNGKLGIGTTTPQRALQVNSNGTATAFFGTDPSGNYLTWGTTANAVVGINHNSSGTELQALDLGNSNSPLSANTSTALTFSFRTSGNANGIGAKISASTINDTYETANLILSATNHIILNPTGRVGIGTSNIPADYKLAVAGNIIAEKLRVKPQSGWPDYVFDSSHRLPSLNELEDYIQKNKHLPGVPSAVEVEKNGLDLGDNQSILLKKIEEITLYMFEMNKKLEKVSAENEELKRKLNAKEK